ncbi:MAG: 3-dehydroquinate synthase [Muribaculum sp.]|nr:3-dehydroquinate synthase [Muribaculum sp.]
MNETENTKNAAANLLFTNHVAQALDELVEKLEPVSVHLLVDANTATFVLPRMQQESAVVRNAKIIETGGAGELFKNLSTVSDIWKQLSDDGATRRSLLINLGGGVITDMGAFAAATFKRGIPFVNIPTTLLGAVDASVGGKTGINFNSLKNEIGLFADAELVIVSTTFFRTLTSQQLLEGYAEMIKHALLTSDEMTTRLLKYNVTAYEPDQLLKLLRESVEVKCKYVADDPTDCNTRQSLNLGHTFAHAFEELAMERKAPLSHGYAVAFGLVASLILSHMKLNMPTATLNAYTDYVRNHYGVFDFSCDDYPRLLSYMAHDKKNITNDDGVYTFTLLRNVGEPLVKQSIAATDVTAALDIYRDMLL